MNITKGLFARWIFVTGLVFLVLGFVSSGCTLPEKEFDPNIKGPQVIAHPEIISLGVAALTKTPLVFKGKGFLPGDSVFISLLGVKKKDKAVDLAIADANIDKNGYFTAKVSTLVKVSELLQAKIGSNKKMENIIVITQPPIPAGTYTVRAVSMESDKKAECKLVVNKPSLLDRFKDWLGIKMGKIVEK